jgi:hypothetical protein
VQQALRIARSLRPGFVALTRQETRASRFVTAL